MKRRPPVVVLKVRAKVGKVDKVGRCELRRRGEMETYARAIRACAASGESRRVVWSKSERTCALTLAPFCSKTLTTLNVFSMLAC